jgi:hypothetical protein
VAEHQQLLEASSREFVQELFASEPVSKRCLVKASRSPVHSGIFVLQHLQCDA